PASQRGHREAPPVSGPAEAFALNPSTSPPTGLRTVTSRRRFLGSLVSASAALPTLPALTNDALAHVVRTVGAVAGRPPAAIAEDEDFWREIQNGFTLDRTLINLNNGGVSPSPRMITTWRQRERRDGIVLKQIRFPVPPPSQDDLARRFAEAITPRTKVIHVCHITNLTGQIFPIRKIMQIARDRGIETIADGAHAYAHF